MQHLQTIKGQMSLGCPGTAQSFRTISHPERRMASRRRMNVRAAVSAPASMTTRLFEELEAACTEYARVPPSLVSPNAGAGFEWRQRPGLGANGLGRAPQPAHLSTAFASASAEIGGRRRCSGGHAEAC